MNYTDIIKFGSLKQPQEFVKEALEKDPYIQKPTQSKMTEKEQRFQDISVTVVTTVALTLAAVLTVRMYSGVL